MTGLTVGRRPPHPPPRRVQLGGDAWVLVAEVLPDVALPVPFRPQDGPPLDAEQRAALEQILRDAGLLTSDDPNLLDSLRPALRDGLLTHSQPLVVVDASVGLGERQRITRLAIGGHLASGLVREQRPAAADELELGPVEISVMLIDDVATEVLRGFGDLGGEPDREPLQLDAAVSVAAVHALGDHHSDLARAVLGRPAVPAPLRALADGLQVVAQIAVAGDSGTRVLVALRTADGWWTVGMSDEDVVLRPVGEDELVTDIASALAVALCSRAAPAVGTPG